jgi:hypothetical protein
LALNLVLFVFIYYKCVCVLMCARDSISLHPKFIIFFSSPHQPPLQRQHKEKDSDSDAGQACNFCAQCATWCNVMITRAYVSPSSRSPVLRGPVIFRSSYHLFIVAHSRYPRKPKRFGCMVGNSTRMTMQCIVDIRVVQMQASVLRGEKIRESPEKRHRVLDISR